MSFNIVDVELESGEVAKGLVDAGEARQSPIVVDFRSPKLKHRLKNGADGELVVKALNVKRSERAGLLIYDFTAGLGIEAFLLSQAGFNVVAFERDPLVFQLLEDGLRRFHQTEKRTESEAAKLGEAKVSLEFRAGDAVTFVRENPTGPRPYAVILDPMFEGDATDGKSLPKKEMATLRRMLPSSGESELRALFAAAWSIADARVIVKRPYGAPDLASEDPKTGRPLKPAHRLEGKTARFDIYSCR